MLHVTVNVIEVYNMRRNDTRLLAEVIWPDRKSRCDDDFDHPAKHGHQTTAGALACAAEMDRHRARLEPRRAS